MAPIHKRARHPDDDDDLLEHEEASSSLQSKRRRVSSDGAAVQPVAQAEYGEYPYEERRDRQYEDLEFTKADDLRAKRILAERYEQIREQIPAENAIIEEVKCENFMCHSRLTVKLGPFINFIIGHNGSGKSAVLTALSLCLGGKPTSTNRGQSLKAFIKAGEESAMLSVKIKNQGSSAYQPDVYGESIIVERHFSHTSSGFKIKNANGKVISTRKGDLEDITDAFALQIDNPMNVLTQDNARQFLNHSGPADKFKFFMQGTQLEQLSNDYKILEESLDRTEGQLMKAQEIVEDHSKRFHEAKKRLAASAEHENLRRQIKNAAHQQFWAMVIQLEKNRDAKRQKVEDAEAEIIQRTSESDLQSERYEELKKELDEVQESIALIEQKVRPYEEDEAAKSQELSEAEEAIREAIEEERSILTEVQTKRKEISTYEEKQREQRERQEAADGGLLANLHDEIDRAKALRDTALQNQTKHADTLPQLLAAKSTALKRLEHRSRHVQAVRDEFEQAKSLLRQHNNKQGAWTRAYKQQQQLESLLRAIHSERRWRQPPIGPFGQSIQLLKPEWSPILESLFSGFLNAFAVTTKDDQTLLSNLMRRSNYHASVYIVDDAPLSRLQEPDANLDTILRVLKIDDERVKNACITIQAIDQMVLIKSRSEANTFMSTPQTNVKACLAMHDTKSGEGHRFSTTASGSKSMQPIPRWAGASRMRSDDAAQKEIYEQRLSQSTEDLRTAEAEVKQLNVELQQADRAIREHNAASGRAKEAVERAQERVDELEDQLQAATPQAAGDLAAIEEQIQQCQQELHIHESTFQNVKANKQRQVIEKAKIKKELNKIQADKKQAQNELDIARSLEREADLKRQKALYIKNQAVSAIEDAVANKQSAERALREAEKEVVDATAKTMAHVKERVPVADGDTPEILSKRRERLKRELASAEEALGATHEELAEQAAQAKTDFNKAKIGLDAIERHSQALKQSMADRQDRWKKFRRFIASRARIMFTYLMSERDFKGSLVIDSKSKLLDIKVEPDPTKQNSDGRQTTTLSGGEKSFSTICLLLSLWDAMGAPIRCLDEFDVFMDSVNRDISMRMMIQAARRSVSRQFVLITPQAMGNVAFGEDVKIIKMSDPERGQQTLPFAA